VTSLTPINLTPHPICVYGDQVPDQFDPAQIEPELVIEPSGEVARIGEIDHGDFRLPNCSAPATFVTYRRVVGLPPESRDQAGEYTHYYVVSLPLALAQIHQRSDLLVPYRQVRNPQGTVIGCKCLALPV
jgi:hypothetical protein